MKSGSRIWEMGKGRGTRETFPFNGHRTVAEAWHCKFPSVRQKYGINPKPRKVKLKRMTGSAEFTATSFV